MGLRARLNQFLSCTYVLQHFLIPIDDQFSFTTYVDCTPLLLFLNFKMDLLFHTQSNHEMYRYSLTVVSFLSEYRTKV